jgi:cathepsin L
MSVDCYDGYGNQGCNGGLMDSAFQYIEDKGGLETESEYPYTAEGGDCTFDKSKVVATCIGFTDVTSGSETDLQSSVATVGPVSVAIDASQQSFHLYESGVYDECSSVDLDHGVLAVGYGTDSESGKDYWLVKIVGQKHGETTVTSRCLEIMIISVV